MTTFSKLITSIVSDLHQVGCIKDADELQCLANLALDQTLLADRRKDALKQIEMRCHAKWLGDFYLPYLSQKDWWGRLEKLGSQPRSICNPFDSFKGSMRRSQGSTTSGIAIKIWTAHFA